MALIKRTDGDTGSGENGRPKCNDDTYVQPTTGTTTGASTKSVSVYETIGGSNAGITATITGEAAPFIERSKELRKAATGTLIRDLSYGEVVGPYLTTKSSCFLSNVGIAGGITNSNIWYDHAKYYTRYNARYWYDLLPWNMILPNCVGGARGRFQELIVDDQKYLHSQRNSAPNSDPENWINRGPFANHEISTTPKDGYKQAGTNLYLWEDKDGYYGPVGGLWGWGSASGGAPPLPGAHVTWENKVYDLSHVEFIEAVYNAGQEDCYIVTTSSSYADYSDTGVLCMHKIGKHDFSHDLYVPYHNRWYKTKFFYTPLCTYSNIDGLAFKQITLSYEAPPESQTEAYEEIKNIIATQELKVGEKVQIEQFGNEKADGTGKKINRLLSIGYIKSIGAAGLPYKFEVVDKQTNGKLIGYYSREGLYKMAN